MDNYIYCGTVVYHHVLYGVMWDKDSERVWVNKPGDLAFGEGNYNEIKAKNTEEALKMALVMLESAGK